MCRTQRNGDYEKTSPPLSHVFFCQSFGLICETGNCTAWRVSELGSFKLQPVLLALGTRPGRVRSKGHGFFHGGPAVRAPGRTSGAGEVCGRGVGGNTWCSRIATYAAVQCG